jgi:serine/threonine protein kinase
MQPDEMVTDNLKLVRALDRGSMGSVWVAFNVALQTEVAVKFMDEGLATDQNFVARFIREARAAAKMKTNHVVNIQNVGQTNAGLPYISMELLQGETLKQRVSGGTAITNAEVNTVVKHVARALKEAHNVGIVHRDIKPANIFITEQDDELVVKIIDFGIAKQQSDNLTMTQTHDKMGTPFYMAPEQLISAKHVDHRADLWSVGVCAYHALIGQVPFFAKSFADLCVEVAMCRYTPATERRDDLPGSVDAWFGKLLVKDPNDRFDSAKEMATAFAKAIEGESF